MLKKLLLFTPLLGFALSLEEAVKTALSNNPEVKAQIYQYRAAKEDFKSAVAQRFGEVSLFWSYTQYKFPRVVAPISPPVTPSNFAVDDQVRTYGFRYRVRLFDGCGQLFTILAKRDTAERTVLGEGDVYIAERGIWHGDSIFHGDEEVGECWILDVFVPPRSDLEGTV